VNVTCVVLTIVQQRANIFACFFAGITEVADCVTVVVPSSASCEYRDIGAGDMQPVSVKPVNINTASSSADIKASQTEETFHAAEDPKSVNREISAACSVTDNVNTSLSQSPTSTMLPTADVMEAYNAKTLLQTAVESDIAGADESRDASVISNDASVNDPGIQGAAMQPLDERTEQVAALQAEQQQQVVKRESDSPSDTLMSCISESPAGNDSVFYTPPSNISYSKAANDNVSPSELQKNQHSLQETAKAPSERKVVIYKRSDSSVDSERRVTDTECSQSMLNAQERADEDGFDHFTDNMRSEGPLETRDIQERHSDDDDGIDDDDDDDDIDEDVDQNEGRADDVLDKGAADKKMTAESQENRNEVTVSTTDKKKRKKKKKNKKNKQQLKQTQSTAVGKSVPSSTVTSETDNLESLQITRPPPPRQPEMVNTDGVTENNCAQCATATETGVTDIGGKCIEHSVTSQVRQNVRESSDTPAAETVPPTDADIEANGTSDAADHHRKQETDKCSEQKHVKCSGSDPDSANVSHYTRSRRKLKPDKGTDGSDLQHCSENSKNVKSEEPLEQRQMNTDRESENKATQSDASTENRTSNTKTTDTSDAASRQGSSYAEVCTYCIFNIILQYMHECAISPIITTIVTGSIVRSTSRRYLFTQRPILRFFTPQGRHVAPMG